MDTVFQLGADTKVLASVLREAAVGDVVLYTKLSSSIGRDVQGDARASLQTARSIVQREDNMVFEADRNVGLRRLNDHEIVALWDKQRDHIRRVSKKTAKKVSCVDYDALPREMQVRHNASLSMAAAITMMVSEKSTKRLEQKIEDAGTQIPAAKAAIAALGGVV